jgi:hypothetical protein
VVTATAEQTAARILLMSLVLIKETGAGLTDANSYADRADGDTYHLGHLYATSWTNATDAKKEAALVMATRLIDSCYQFNGFRVRNDQALQWPRRRCVDPDKWGEWETILRSNSGLSYFQENVIPPALRDATCEFARELIRVNRTDPPAGEGVSQVSLTGATYIQYDKKDSRPIVPKPVQLILMKLGTYLANRTGMARLVRV